MTDFLKRFYNATVQISFKKIIRVFHKPFYWLLPINNQGNGINPYFQVQRELLNNRIIEESLNNTDYLDRAIIITNDLSNGIYNLADLESETLVVRRLIARPNLLNEILNLRRMREMRTVTPDQLIPDFVGVNSPTLEIELDLSLEQASNFKSSLNLDEIEGILLQDNLVSSLGSVLEVIEKFI
jgi:hypothetical protein